MVLIIDGHNLIPHIPGINLSDPDDEMRLIDVLQAYCRKQRKNAEVFFDRAPVGQARIQQFGLVRAHFIREGTTADTAIIAYLKKLGKRAKNVTVVSSDRQVVVAARAVHAPVMKSEVFVAAWADLMDEEPELEPQDHLLSADEVKYWENVFKRGHPPGHE